LRREAIGEYSVENAWQIEDFIQHIQQESYPEDASL
jgi:hypothetical protein